MHEFIRADILNHIPQNLHNPIPGSGGNTFDQSNSVGVGIDTINVAGSPSTTYSSVEHYLQIMSHPYAYATNIELIAASQLYGVEFCVTLDGSDYPQPPPDNIIVPYATFYTIEIPSTTPLSDTINMWTTHSNILYPTSSPPIAISYSM